MLIGSLAKMISACIARCYQRILRRITVCRDAERKPLHLSRILDVLVQFFPARHFNGAVKPAMGVVASLMQILLEISWETLGIGLNQTHMLLLSVSSSEMRFSGLTPATYMPW